MTVREGEGEERGEGGRIEREKRKRERERERGGGLFPKYKVEAASEDDQDYDVYLISDLFCFTLVVSSGVDVKGQIKLQSILCI